MSAKKTVKKSSRISTTAKKIAAPTSSSKTASAVAEPVAAKTAPAAVVPVKPVAASPTAPAVVVAAPAIPAPTTAPVATPTATVVAPAAAVSAPSEVVTTLIQALHDPSAEAAREAALSLGKLGDRAAVGALVEVVANANGYFHNIVRAAACASLGQLRDLNATPALLSAVSDPMAEASAEAVRALGELADERAVEPLADVLKNERGYFLPVVRMAAVTALRNFRVPKATMVLKALAANGAEDPELRAAAA